MKKQYGVLIISASLFLTGCGETKTVQVSTEPVKEVKSVVKEEGKEVVKEDTTIKVGSSVAAKWGNGQWYGATVTLVGDATYDVKYDDGTSGTVSKSDAKYVLSKPDLKNGDKVFAVWSDGGQYYSGVIQEAKTDGAMVKWDDGSKPSFILNGKITKEVLPVTASVITPTKSTESIVTTPSIGVTYKVGDVVAGEWSAGSWWLATVSKVDGDNVSLDYADGTKGTLKSAKIKLMDKKIKIAEGEKVMAVWGGKFYPGTVTEVKENVGATIKWDDGSAPLFVNFGQIYK